MERLPDELFVLIFRYLHKFDLLYSFHNLNRRIQQIIEPSQYNIDLTEETNLSFKHFVAFLEHILPIQGTAVRSLILNGNQQLQLLHPYLHHLTHLEYLTLKSNSNPENSVYAQQIKHFLTDALSLPFLSELTISDSASETLLETTSSFASKNLTILTLLSRNGFPNFQKVSQMPYIKYLSIDLQSITRLIKVFEIMPNLEELKLSMVFFRNLENIDHLKVPQKLQKLHLEFGNYRKFGTQPSKDTIEKFLNVFKNQISSLTMVTINAVEEFSKFEEFQSLVNNFTHLQTFEYYIRTNYQPNSSLFPNVQQLFGSRYCFYTFPRPQFFDTLSSRATLQCTLNSDLSLQELLDCTTLISSTDSNSFTLPASRFEWKDNNIKLINLKELQINFLIEDMKADVREFFSKVLSLSLNLNTLTVTSNDAEKMIQQLTELIPVVSHSNKITHLICVGAGIENYHTTFFYDLSKIFPNLKTLTFRRNYQSIEEHATILTTNFIQELRKYFPGLIRLTLEIQNHVVFEKYKRDFYETQEQTEKSSLCFTSEDGNFYNIWF